MALIDNNKLKKYHGAVLNLIHSKINDSECESYAKTQRDGVLYLTKDTCQLWYNGVCCTSQYDGTMSHEYVDLGLPSGILWATCNLGADTPEEFGDYYTWGEVKPKLLAGESSYKWYSNNQYTKYNNSDLKKVLDAEDDASVLKLGGNWHIPTIENWKELISNCKRTIVRREDNSIQGYLYTSNINNNSVFFPQAGYQEYVQLDNLYSYYTHYWSSNRSDSSVYSAQFANLRDNYTSTCYRTHCLPIRPVCNKIPVYSHDFTKTSSEVDTLEQNVVYFLQDSGQIYLNGKYYGIPVTRYEEDQRAISGILNMFNQINSWQDE